MKAKRGWVRFGRVVLLSLLVLGAGWYVLEGRRDPVERLLDEFRANYESSFLDFLQGLPGFNFERNARHPDLTKKDLVALEEAAVPLLGEALLQDPVWDVRVFAAEVFREGRWTNSVPFLRAALADGAVEVRQAALLALAELATPELIPELLQLVKTDPFKETSQIALLVINAIEGEQARACMFALCADQDPVIRRQATGALHLREDEPGVVAVLEARVSDSDVEVRREAALSLGYMAGTAATDALLRLLNDADADVRGSAAWGLRSRSEPRVVDALHERLPDEAAVREWVVKSLCTISDPRSAPVLARALREEQNDAALQNMAQALGYFHHPDPEIIASLSNVLQHEKNVTRRVALWSLGHIGDPACRAPVAGFLERARDPQQRSLAIHVLMQIGGPEIRAHFIAALDDPHEDVRYAAALGLGDVGFPGDLDLLLKRVEHGSGKEIQGAAEALEKFGDPRAEPVLLRALRAQALQAESDPFAGEQIARAIGRCRGPGALDALLRYRDFGLSEGEAVMSLGALGQKKALPAIRKALRSGEIANRYFAITALGEIGDPSEVPLLLRHFQSSKQLRHKVAVIDALGALGSPEALPLLEEILSRKRYRDYRRRALQALGKIRHPDSGRMLGRMLRSKNEFELQEACYGLAALGDNSHHDALRTLCGHKKAGLVASRALAQLSGEVTPRLREGITSHHARERFEACSALLRLESDEARALLESRRDDPHRALRLLAEGALAGEGLHALARVLKDPKPENRRWAREALLMHGGLETRPLLELAAQDRDVLTRQLAESALKRLNRAEN